MGFGDWGELAAPALRCAALLALGRRGASRRETVEHVAVPGRSATGFGDSCRTGHSVATAPQALRLR